MAFVSSGAICRGCGRSKSGGNLVSQADLYSQDEFLTEDGYLFLNPY